MGFLNHATNNIIIDAVLTERGRELLANENFNVSNFALGDDEVDYSIIQKYGLTIGKEKIEKNTPVFEANPNENIAIKSFLITYPNPVNNLSSMPKLSWSNKSSGQTVLDLTYSEVSSTLSSASITISNMVESLSGSETLDNAITDRQFYVKVHNRLLSVTNGQSLDSDINNIETFIVSTSTATNPQWSNQVSATFTINSLGIVNNSSFTSFSSVLNTNKINTNIQVIGAQSGASLVIPVVITKQ